METSELPISLRDLPASNLSEEELTLLQELSDVDSELERQEQNNKAQFYVPNGKAAVRIDNTEASKWRVIALNGEPLISGLATKDEAIEKMNAYLASLRLRLPTEAEFAEAEVLRQKQAADRDAAAEARKSKRQRAA